MVRNILRIQKLSTNHPFSHSNWPHLLLCVTQGEGPPFIQRYITLTVVSQFEWCGELAAMNIIAFCAVMAPTELSAAPPVCEMHLSRRFACDVDARVCEPPTQTDRTSEYVRGVFIWYNGALMVPSARAYTLKYWSAARWVGAVVGGGDGALVHASGACVHCLLMTTMIYLISITACINIYIHSSIPPRVRAGHCAPRGACWLDVYYKILPCKFNLFACDWCCAQCFDVF